MIDGHMISERTSLLIHKKIAAIVDDKPDLLDQVRRHLQFKLGKVGGTSGEELWLLILKRPWDQIKPRMLDPGPEGRLLRSNTPFPFILDPIDTDERRRLWKQAKAELSVEMT